MKDLESNQKIAYRLVGQDEADIKKNLIFLKALLEKLWSEKIKMKWLLSARPLVKEISR